MNQDCYVFLTQQHSFYPLVLCLEALEHIRTLLIAVTVCVY